MAGAMMGTGAGNFAEGGYVGGMPDNRIDNRPIRADEGEFVIRRQAADALGPGLLNLMNRAGGPEFGQRGAFQGDWRDRRSPGLPLPVPPGMPPGGPQAGQRGAFQGQWPRRPALLGLG